MRALLVGMLIALSGCGGTTPPAAPAAQEMGVDAAAERVSIEAVLDDWHKAASEADEVRYFGHMAEDAVFMGTDATERWDKAAFRAYAHPHFEKGKAWSFTATRREVMVSDDGELAWFDEDLATPNLGPARGSGVLRKVDGAWLIAHYNLTITVPNDRFAEVKSVLGTSPSLVSGVAVFAADEVLPMLVPKSRRHVRHCKDREIKHNALVVGPNDPELGGFPLADVIVRIALGQVSVKTKVPQPVVFASDDCLYVPRIQGVQLGQQVRFENRSATMVNIQAKLGYEQLFNSGVPKGADPIEHTFASTGMHIVQSSVQPWMRAFVWVSDNPFFAVTDETGKFSIRGIPKGEYELEAWHSFVGLKKQRIRIVDGQATAPVKFVWSGEEEEPPENKGELDDLF